MSSVSFGFTQTTQPTASHPLTFELQHILDSPELLGKVFALQAEVVAESRKRLTAKIEATEQQWDSARLAAKAARDAFHLHKQDELMTQNDVLNANAKMMAAHRLVSAWQNAPMDPYASKSEREAHAHTLDEYKRKAQQAEEAAIVANGCQNAYYAEAQKLADDYNAKQLAFANLDGALNQFRSQLEELQAEN